jgi:type 1 glutamine amidotransferase
VHRTDGDFPVAWAKTYGKGRVFYSTLGHADESWDNPVLGRMYLEALRWALRLVDGDATPRSHPGDFVPRTPDWLARGDPNAPLRSPGSLAFARSRCF